MSNSSSLRDRYLELIDQIVQKTLKGQVRSKEQVYQMLLDSVAVGTGELFERSLGDRIVAAQRQSETQSDELKQAKAARSLRALQTIRGEWERWQQHNQASAALTQAVQAVLGTEAEEAQESRLSALLRVLDPNRAQPLNLAQWQQLAKLLSQQAQQSETMTPDRQAEIQEFAQGITQGLDDWHRLENHLVSWIYEQGQGQLGFGGVPGERGPWALWAKQVNSPYLKALFQQLALEQSITEWVAQSNDFRITTLIELVVVLRCLQQGLVAWFDKLVYDSKVGAKLSISTFLGFAVIWSQLANGLSRGGLGSIDRSRLFDGCLQITLQILRTFAQQEYFPLYGGIFASFSGQFLRDALNYLDEPLKRAEGTQEKARILTLLGYSQRAQGQTEQAIAFHQEALTIAREAGDSACEVANLNHLSRTYAARSNYGEAINYSQRALILSRQTGDRQGEANALANLGYSEVFQAQQLEATPEVYETAVGYLRQGLQLSERLGDRQSQALCLSSLGIAHVVLEQMTDAIAFLEGGIQAAQFSGDLYLQGLNLAYLAEAHYRLQHQAQAIAAGSIGMYLLEQIMSMSWRQPAGLLTILKGQLGDEAFQSLLTQQRSQIISVIGVDGYDYLPELLKRYQQEG